MKATNTMKIGLPKYYIATNADKRRIIQAAEEGDVQRVRELLNGLGTVEEVEARDQKFEDQFKPMETIDV